MEWCPACSTPESKAKLSCAHVLAVCGAVQAIRVSSGYKAFTDECKAGGLSSAQTYSAFLNGKSGDGTTGVSRQDHLKRGYVLIDIQKRWLAVWQVVHRSVQYTDRFL
jgi:hypothetical protein